MAALYLARDPVIDRLVAIKVLREGLDTQELRERFAREARSAGRLRHLNIVTIFDVGEHDGAPFIAMEYIPGETLAQMIRRGGLMTLSRRLVLIEDLCAGLGYAHSAGVVHRDIKPGNIMVDPEGVLKILDFGIARFGDSSMTQAGVLMGTLNYMSPEQVAGLPIDHRSDIFAVGAVAYELLSSRQAFPGSIRDGVLHRILHGSPQPLDQVVPGLDPDIVRIVSRALEKEPDRRYQDLLKMRREIVQVRQRLPIDEPAVADESVETVLVAPAETPTPKSGPPRSTDPALLEKRRRAEIERLIAEARRAMEAGQHQAAIDASEQVLLLDANQRDALDLLDTAREAARRAQVGEWLEQARTNLSRGDVTVAADLVERTLALDPASQEAIGLQEEVKAALAERERLARAAGIAERARDRLDEGSPESAIALAREALDLDRDCAPAAQVQAEAEALLEKRRRQEEERRRRDEERRRVEEERRRQEHERQAREAIRQAEAAFAAGERAAAFAALDAFAPPHPLIAPAVERLKAEEAAIEQRRRDEEERRKAEAARLAREEEERRKAEAARLAREREAEERRKAEAARLAREEEERRKAEAARLAREEEERRKAEAARLAREEEERRKAEAARLAREEEARRKAEEARLAREEEARRKAEEERLARERQIAEALERARAALRAQGFDDALGALRRVRQLDSANEAVAALEQEAQAGKAAQAAALEHRRRFETAMREAAALLTSGDFAAARTRAADAVALEPSDASAARLQHDIARAVEQAEADARRARELQEKLDAASRLLAAHDLPAAMEQAQQAVALDPANKAATALREKIAAAIATEEAAAARVRDIQARLAEASRSLEAGELDAARTAVDAALRLDRHHEAARALRGRVDEAAAAATRAAAERRKIQETIAKAAAMRSDEKAVALLRGVLNVEPDNAEARRLLEEREARVAAAASRSVTRTQGTSPHATPSSSAPARSFRVTPRAAAAAIAIAALAIIGVLWLRPASHSPQPIAATSSFEKAKSPGGQSASVPQPSNAAEPAAPPPAPPPATADNTAKEGTAGTGTAPRDSAAAEKVLTVRRQARLEIRRGEREKALATLASGLQLQPDDAELSALLEGLVREAREGASGARQRASSAGASAASVSSFAKATDAERQATALQRSGRMPEAVKQYWNASQLFGEAESAARQASARPTPTTTAAPPEGAVPSPTGGGRAGSGPQPGARTGTDAKPAPPPAPDSSSQQVVPRQLPPSPQPPVNRPVEPPPAATHTTPPASSSAPPPSTPVHEDPTPAIQQALQQYKAAYESLDAEAVRRVQPSLSSGQLDLLRKTFGDYRSYRVEIEDAQIAVNGSQATVSCRVTRRFDPKAGKPGGNTIPTVFHLAKNGSGWVIDRVEARQ